MHWEAFWRFVESPHLSTELPGLEELLPELAISGHCSHSSHGLPSSPRSSFQHCDPLHCALGPLE